QTELKQLLKRDLDGAKRLLQEAGVTNLSFELSVANFGEASVAGAELIQAQLKEAGITARLKLLSGTEYNQGVVARREFEVYNAIAQPIGVTNAELISRFRSGGDRNVFKASDPQLDKLIDQQAVLIKDPDGRKKILQDIQRRVIEDCFLVGIVANTGWT